MSVEKWVRHQRTIGVRYRLVVTVPGEFLSGIDGLVGAFSLGLVYSNMGLSYMMWAERAVAYPSNSHSRTGELPEDPPSADQQL